MTSLRDATQEHLAEPRGVWHALADLTRFADEDDLPLPADPRKVTAAPSLGYIAVELATLAELAAWAADARFRPHVSDPELHGGARDVWGWVGSHHVDLWVHETEPVAVPA